MRNKFILYGLLNLLFIFIFSSCTDERLTDFSSETSSGQEMTIYLHTKEATFVESRNGDETEVLDNVVVYALDADGQVLKNIYQQLDNRNYVTMYIPEGASSLFAICNYDNPDELLQKKKLDEIKELKITIENYEEAYKGCYVMSSIDAVAIEGTTLNIPVYRVAAHFDVKINFAPESEEEQTFDITSVMLYNIPNVTWVVRHGEDKENNTLPLSANSNDAMYSNGSLSSEAFLSNQTVDFIRETDGTSEADDIDYTLSFDMFENRRGGVDRDNYPWPSSYQDNKQLYKAEIAKGEQFEYATYLKITGVYKVGNGLVREVSYKIYLGENNFSDYNVYRNYKYDYTITIKSGTSDGIDTRVEAENLTSMKVYASLDEPLDAHFNAVRAMVYSPGKWEMYVKNPDATPWLEISTSELYIPNKLDNTGQNVNAAQYKLEGSGGITYVYIHTDEYIREQNSPQQNDLQQVRSGIICYKNNTGAIQELEVKQYPAQLVILDYYDALTVKHVKDTFFVERILEEKNIEWGFKEYWSLTMDNLITTGQWDGLSNTRKLFETALHGDGFEGDANDPDPGLDLPGLEDPAYPGATGPHGEQGWAVPTNVAVGYAIAKNRDRNGNGRIDYDEIVWYMPAMKELEAIYEHLERKEVDFEATTEKFASSTPSAAGPNAANPGRFYYIKMATGDLSLAMRNRAYNVLCCRRKGAWQGNADAGGGGEVTIPDGGYGDEDFIMPKTETSN